MHSLDKEGCPAGAGWFGSPLGGPLPLRKSASGSLPGFAERHGLRRLFRQQPLGARD